MHTPCSQCPFRKDCLKGWLGASRMQEILTQDKFCCHKTTFGKEEDRKQCAGHMLLRGNANTFMRLGPLFIEGFSIRGQKLVFETEEACISHHSNQRDYEG